MIKKKDLFKELHKSLRENRPIELLVETEFYHKERLLNFFKRRAIKIHNFEYIPYFSVILDPKIALHISKYVTKGILSNEIRESENLLKLIKSIEKSNKVHVRVFDYNENQEKERKTGKKTFDSFWNLKAIHSYEANNKADGSGVNVGIIDTGIDYTHKEILDNFTDLKGYDFIMNNTNPFDLNGHGTHVSGIVAGKTCGIAKKVNLYAIRVLDADGAGSEVTVMQGIEWALKNNMHIINMSLGSEEASKAFEDLCDYAFNNNLLMVAAAGNEGFGYSYPAAFDGVISVAAINTELKHAYFSNVADTNDISAPGVSILSSFPDNTYRVLDGTSMATPHVTGAISLLLGLNQNPGREKLESILKGTAEILTNNTKFPYKEVYGSGLLRADNMVNSMLEQILTYSRIKRVGRGINESF